MRYGLLEDQRRMPRKLKNRYFGKRMQRGKLRKLLASVTIGERRAKTMYEMSDIKPYPFCPHCGFAGFYGTGNRAEYPEHWEYFRCLKCNEVVGYVDNSPFVHALECKENNYDPIF